MSRNNRVSKSVKIKACENYHSGKESYKSIAKSIGVSLITMQQWYSAFTYHGPSAFDSSNRNNAYSKEFKTAVAKLYLSGESSSMELSGKYNISLGMVKRWIKKYNNGIELKDYNPKGEVYTMKSRKTTPEERLEIVKWVITNNLNYKDAAEKYSIKYALVYRWVKKYLKDGESSLEYKKRGPKEITKINEAELDEIGRLKLELERERTRRELAEFRLELLKKKEEFEKALYSRK
jgi:transposase-like protein